MREGAALQQSHLKVVEMADISTVLPGSPNTRSSCLFKALMAEVGRASLDSAFDSSGTT